MKTAEEKAENFVKAIKNQGYDKDMVELALVLLLKEQDRETRHTCAEAVMQIGRGCDCTQCGMLRIQAHAACMNVKTV